MAEFLLLAATPIAFIVITNSIYRKPLNSSNETKKLFLLFCGVLIFLSLALRSRYVGMDSEGYYNVWQYFCNAGFSEIDAYAERSGMEKGFLFCVWCLSKVFKNAQTIFVITGALYAFSICRFFYLNSKDVSISVIMFISLGLYEFMFQCMRQAIAMCICLFAIEFCKKRKLIKFILFILLAMCFHQTAVVFLPVYFIYGIPLKASTRFLSIGIGATVVGFSVPLATIANEWFDREYEGAVQAGGYVAVAIYVLIIILTILFQQHLTLDKNFSFFYFITFIGLTIYLMRYMGVRISERISYYYMFGQTILLPNTVQSLDQKTKIILKCLIALLCIALFAYRLKGGDLIPYKFFWQ